MCAIFPWWLEIPPTTRFYNREPLLTQGALLGFVGNDVQLQHRKVFGIKADFAVTPVDDVAHAGKPGVGVLHKVDNLEYGTSRCHNILYDKDTFPGTDLKAAPKFHFAVLAFCENRANLKHSAHLRANDNPSNGGRDDQLHVSVFEVLRDLTAEQVKVFGILQHTCALEILRAVKAGRESKMSLEKGFCLAENVEDLLFRKFHGDRRLKVRE
jgi:hypothetical protein